MADLLCSLERKVGLPSSLMSETIKAKALGDVAHFIKSILSFTKLKPRLNQELDRLKLRASSLLTFVRQSAGMSVQ